MRPIIFNGSPSLRMALTTCVAALRTGEVAAVEQMMTMLLPYSETPFRKASLPAASGLQKQLELEYSVKLGGSVHEVKAFTAEEKRAADAVLCETCLASTVYQA
jgi:hypothetical protein